MSEELLTRNVQFSVKTQGSSSIFQLTRGEERIGLLIFYFPQKFSKEEAIDIRRYEIDLERVAQLDYIEVFSGHKRKGYGSFLVKKFERMCSELGASGVILDLRNSEIVKKFYEKNGYVPFHESEKRYLGRMVKKL